MSTKKLNHSPNALLGSPRAEQPPSALLPEKTVHRSLRGVCISIKQYPGAPTHSNNGRRKSRDGPAGGDRETRDCTKEARGHCARYLSPGTKVPSPSGSIKVGPRNTRLSRISEIGLRKRRTAVLWAIRILAHQPGGSAGGEQLEKHRRKCPCCYDTGSSRIIGRHREVDWGGGEVSSAWL